ncbi:MAG: 16S rRNA (cytosine(1402)-N(4))-methyltransferase RsmH, partial [Bullifex sp.]
MEICHYPVLHEEVLEYLKPVSEHPVMIDCTTGEGGHTSLFLGRYDDLTVIGLDRDREIQKKAIIRLEEYGDRFQPVNCWFNDYLRERESESADMILFDLGISVFHYVESERGFSFSSDERLDMRLNAEQELSAEDVVNIYPETELADIIYRYGEERYSRRIAERICRERQTKRITTAKQLADIVAAAVPAAYRHGRINPATRTFQ